jgi:hypothetical protein
VPTDSRFCGLGYESPEGGVFWASPARLPLLSAPYPEAGFGGGVRTEYLVGADFGFAVPAAATVLGIEVVWSRLRTPDSSPSAVIADAGVFLVKYGTIGTTNKAAPAPWTDVLTSQAYGGPSDLWGETWDAAAVNDPSFGTALVVESDIVYPYAAEVQSVQIAVTYSLPFGAPTRTVVARRFEAPHEPQFAE